MDSRGVSKVSSFTYPPSYSLCLNWILFVTIHFPSFFVSLAISVPKKFHAFSLCPLNIVVWNIAMIVGLTVVKANVYLDSSGKHNKFAITRAQVISYPQMLCELDSGRKVEDPELLEAIRLTVILNRVLNWQWEQLLVFFHQLKR